MDPRNRLLGHLFDSRDHRRVAQGERVENHLRQADGIIGVGLPGPSERGAQRLHHAGRRKEAAVVRKDDARRLWHLRDLREQGREVPSTALALPLPAARFKQPEPHDVGQQPHAAEDSGLVREIRARRRLGQHRCVALDTNERPGA
jgi:hypothetical protein